MLALLFVACGDEGRQPPTGNQAGDDRPRGRGGDGGDGGTENPGGSSGTGGTGGSGGSASPVLRVDAVRPPRGTMLGGDSVLIEGAGFVLTAPEDRKPSDVTEVYFGSNPAIGARVIDDDTILATTPPGVAGDADVVVKNPSGEAVCTGCYRYQAPVELDSVEPADGPIHGGITVRLRGEHLRAGMIVTFGSRAALDVQAEPDGSLVAILPPGDVAGSVDVRVYDADGQDHLRKAFNYVAPLEIDRVDPPGGPIAGGNTFVIEGSGFTAGAEVFVGGTRANATLHPDGRLQVIAPAAAAAGAATIEVRTSAGSAFAQYGYFDPAETGVRLIALSPTSGPIAGGERITLVGSNLDRGNLTVRFGGVLADDAVALSSNLVEATLPPGASAGPVDVELRVTGGADALAGAFRYVDAIGVQAVDPASGPVAGGTQITITGTGFPAGARVFVGALEATAVERLGPTSIRAVTPRGTDGPVPVRVVHPADPANEGVLAGGFTYFGPFSVARIDPTTGAQAGGTRVIARGTGFRQDLAAQFADVAAQAVEVLDPFTAVITTPRGNPGTVDVAFENGGGDRVVLDGAFTYYDPSDSEGGSSGGLLTGTLNVTVLDNGVARRGVPLPGVLVILGTEDTTSLQGFTDDRGQITFSDPSLVKAQIVTAALDGYQSATVVNQASENLTILLEPNFEPQECENGLDDDGDGNVDQDDADGCGCSPANYDALESPPDPSLCLCPSMFMAPPAERPTCCDGIDNDGDGALDGEDPDCTCTGGYSEGPLAECSNCIDDDGDGTVDYISMMAPPDSGCQSPSDTEDGMIVAGRVWGFKLPPGRTLGENEVEEAHVRIASPDFIRAPPLFNLMQPIRIIADGGSYAYELAAPRFMAIYAVYGIRNTVTDEFEPLLMGIRRGVNPTPGNDITNADIILDTPLNQSVDVLIENPPTFAGLPGISTVFAYLQLGPEGAIFLGQSTTTDAETARIDKLPPLSGDSFMFQVWGQNPLVPNSITAIFRRQPGDLSQGLHIGPLMGLTQLTEPLGTFGGVIEWASESGPAPDLIEVRIDEVTPFGDLILQWQMIVPGTENRVTVPPQVVEKLRQKYGPGFPLLVTILRGREPRFNYDQWSYSDFDLWRFTSYTMERQFIML